MENLTPQAGPQTEFLRSTADLVIFGGAAGGGKSYALLLEPLYHVNVQGFGAVFFRRTTKQVRNKGGLWDTSKEIYGQIPGAAPVESRLKWVYPASDVTFAHLEYESDIRTWDGAQIPLLGFDELEHFTREQFRYLLSRNRSACGVKPYCRATCNPDPDSWILELIAWYIGEDGYPLKERSGIKRYFATYQDKFVTASTEEELRKVYAFTADTEFKTLSFIPSKLEDNPALLAKDPTYRQNLQLQSQHERERLELGNWKARKQGKLFKREWFQWIDPKADGFVMPVFSRVVVGVDPSGGAGKGHDAQGILAVAKGIDGRFHVLEDATCSLSPMEWARVAVELYHAQKADRIVAETNFGGDMVISTIQAVDRYANVQKVVASRSKAIRAEPIAALYEKGLISHIGAKPELEGELIGFDPEDAAAASPNRMDALVWAITDLMGTKEAALDYLRWLDEQDAAKAKEGTNG